jgi:hypothetical protein
MNKLDYSSFDSPGADFATFVQHELPDRLCAAWCRDYRDTFRNTEIVSIALAPFVYLFDLAGERSVAVYGIMGGKVSPPRDGARMAGFPKAEGPQYHRGHAMPHSAGGGTDINLFIQPGALNVGPFRELEKLAVASPGSFYFVRFLYDLTGSQRPAFIEQGALVNATPARMQTRFFAN